MAKRAASRSTFHQRLPNPSSLVPAKKAALEHFPPVRHGFGVYGNLPKKIATELNSL